MYVYMYMYMYCIYNEVTFGAKPSALATAAITVRRVLIFAVLNMINRHACVLVGFK